jgi:hypothetical protein
LVPPRRRQRHHGPARLLHPAAFGPRLKRRFSPAKSPLLSGLFCVWRPWFSEMRTLRVFTQSPKISNSLKIVKHLRLIC